MDPLLLKSHLSCSVLRNLKARAESTEEFFYRSKLEEVAMDLLEYTQLAEEEIAMGLSWDLLEEFEWLRSNAQSVTKLDFDSNTDHDLSSSSEETDIADIMSEARMLKL
jgi:hypothetical protein